MRVKESSQSARSRTLGPCPFAFGAYHPGIPGVAGCACGFAAATAQWLPGLMHQQCCHVGLGVAARRRAGALPIERRGENWHQVPSCWSY